VTARQTRKPSLATARFSAAPLVAALCAAPAGSQQTAPSPITSPSPSTDLQAELTAAEHFFDHLDRASAADRLRQASARCTDQHELDACDDALRLKPDDPALLIAQGDALVRARRPADAVERYRLAAVLAPGANEVAAKLAAAEGQLQPAGAADASASTPHAAPRKPAASHAALRRYSNSAPEAQSH